MKKRKRKILWYDLLVDENKTLIFFFFLDVTIGGYRAVVKLPIYLIHVEVAGFYANNWASVYHTITTKDTQDVNAVAFKGFVFVQI